MARVGLFIVERREVFDLIGKWWWRAAAALMMVMCCDVSLDSIPTILALLHTYFFMPRVGICAFIGDIVLQYQQF
jgi:hypothetical protein